MDARVEQYSAIPAGVICRHFINGSCRFGTRCRYLHEWPVLPSTQICRYFQKGCCWYGERCRYLHVLQPAGNSAVSGRRSSAPHVHPSSFGNVHFNRRGSEPVIPQAQVTLNPEYRLSPSVGTVLNHQRNLRHSATSTELTSEEESQDNLRQEESVQSSDMVNSSTSDDCLRQELLSIDSVEGGAAAAPGSQEDSEAYRQSKDVTCGICMDTVYEKTSADERRFGILPNCNHAFCLRCIITWRKTKDLQEDVIKSCPQCRVKSSFYVPHNYWVEGDAKDALIASFKEKCSKRRCSYFMRHGCCPFKAECIYWHDEAQRRPSSHLHPVIVDELDGLQLLDFIIAMTLFDDEDEDDDDSLFHLSDYDF